MIHLDARSLSCSTLQFSALQNNTLQGSMLLIKITPKLWRPKMINKYVPVDYPNDVEEGVFDYKQYGKAVFRPVARWQDIERN